MTATIGYDLPVKNYIDELSATGHVTHTPYVKKSVTLHHNAGRLSHEGVLNVWKTRPASAHFDVDAYGRVCQYVKVNEFAWHAGNFTGNKESIGIEMANSTTSPTWQVAEATWKGAARLAAWLFAKVIKARPSSSNLFVHSHWRATACAGPYIKSIWSKVMAETVKWYDYYTKPKTTTTAPKPIAGSTYTGSKLIRTSAVREKYRNPSIERFNGLLWAWLCRNSPDYARKHVKAWMAEPANKYGRESQLATQEMYRIMATRKPKEFTKVTLPTWPGVSGVKVVGGIPV
jgi:hypothetical protein